MIRRLDKLLQGEGCAHCSCCVGKLIRRFEWFGGEYRILFEKTDHIDDIKVQIELKQEVDPKAGRLRKGSSGGINETVGDDPNQP